MTEKKYNFPEIISHFSVQGSAEEVVPYGSGHIHDTFHVKNSEAEYPDYLLQRLNNNVFKKIPELTENIERVTAHLRKKLKSTPGATPDKEVLTVVLSKDNKGYYQDEEGNYWRMYYFLAGTRSYDIIENTNQAYEGGKAYGRFQALLSDMDANSLHETIPFFHDIKSRYKLFHEAIARDPKDRVKDVSAEIAFAEEREEAMSVIWTLGQRGQIPLRTTHNDTKFNNVLLNDKDEAQCVIDLDTVMPGYVAYDFGDAIRTIINKAAEDEKDLDKIKLDIDLFKSFTRGFLEEAGGLLSKEEVNSLAHGVLLLPFIMGLRFLTDYIDGDVYYKIEFPEHNIQRARAQFKLVEELEKKYDLIKGIIKELSLSTNQTV